MGKQAKDHGPGVLINKLGQRLAFERASLRLYDDLIRKCDASMDQASASVVCIDTLKKFRDEECQHAVLIATVMEEFGADPAAMTPDANASTLALMGLTKVINQPETSIAQCLEALQIAELADKTAWENLQELAMNLGLNDVSARFSKPFSQEKIHEGVISRWIKQLVTTAEVIG